MSALPETWCHLKDEGTWSSAVERKAIAEACAAIDAAGVPGISSATARSRSLGSLVEHLGRAAIKLADNSNELMAVQEIILPLSLLLRHKEPPRLEPLAYVDPKKEDMLLSDITSAYLHRDTSSHLGVQYLSRATAKPTFPVLGRILGPLFRTIVPLVVSLRDKALWVHFIVNSGGPNTHISPEVMEALGCTEGIPETLFIRLHGHLLHVSVSTGHFADCNVLGTDFMRLAKIRFQADYYSLECSLEPSVAD